MSTESLELADAQDGSKPSPASCCSNIDKKPLRQLNLAETLEWLQCNQIAADAIDIVKREKVVGYEMSLMSQDELMELLGMTNDYIYKLIDAGLTPLLGGGAAGPAASAAEFWTATSP